MPFDSNNLNPGLNAVEHPHSMLATLFNILVKPAKGLSISIQCATTLATAVLAAAVLVAAALAATAFAPDEPNLQQKQAAPCSGKHSLSNASLNKVSTAWMRAAEVRVEERGAPGRESVSAKRGGEEHSEIAH